MNKMICLDKHETVIDKSDLEMLIKQRDELLEVCKMALIDTQQKLTTKVRKERSKTLQQAINKVEGKL